MLERSALLSVVKFNGGYWYPPKPWSFFQSSLNADYGTPSSTISTISGSFDANMVLLTDGRVYCAPYNTTSAKIYNPTTNTTTTPNGTFPTTTYGAFLGACLMGDGRVFISPSDRTAPRIYDPYANTLTVVPGVWSTSSALLWAGCTLLQDGRVFVGPNRNYANGGRIYDPTTNTVSSTSGTTADLTGADPYIGVVLMSDGRVFHVPWAATRARIYDPSTNTWSIPASGVTLSGGFQGGVLLSDGRVFITGPSPLLYNPTNDSYTTITGTPSTNPGRPVLMSNGKIFITSRNTNNAYIYDPSNDTLTTVTIGTTSSSAILLMDGRIVLGGSNTSLKIYGDPLTSNLPKTRTLSAYANHSW